MASEKFTYFRILSFLSCMKNRDNQRLIENGSFIAWCFGGKAHLVDQGGLMTSMNREYVFESVRKKILSDSGIDRVLVDVFDAVLARISRGDPRSFLKLGSRLSDLGISPLSPQLFAESRRAAEEFVRSSSRCGNNSEINLSVIYLEFVKRQPSLSPSRGALVEAEIEFEEDSIRPLPGMGELMNAVRLRYGKVVFVANSLLPEQVVKNLLIRHGLADSEDAVYVLGDDDQETRKEFYVRVLRAEAIEATKACFLGNTLSSDFVGAKQVGMKNLSLPLATSYSRYESILASSVSDGSDLGGLMADASRLARMWEVESRGSDPVLAEVAAGVAGPLLYGFAAWLLDEAERYGVKRLYFLSREGALPWAVTEVIASRRRAKPDVHYISVSRRSLNIALLSECNETTLEWALTHSSLESLETLLQRVGLAPCDLTEQLESSGLVQERWTSRLTDGERATVRSLLLADPARRIIEDRARERREMIAEYLADHGFFQGEVAGVVDTTGVGSQIYTLNKLRESVCGKQVHGFLYVRDRKNHVSLSDFPQIDTYFYDMNKNGQRPFVPGIKQMLEVFCMPACGSCLGYERDQEGRVVPVLAEIRPDPFHIEVADVVKSVVTRLALEVASNNCSVDSGCSLRKVTLASFDAFWNSPTREEATIWGAYRFQLGSGGEESYRPMARPLDLKDVAIIRSGREHEVYDWHFWRSGSEQLSSWPIRGIFPLFREIKRCLKKMKASVAASKSTFASKS